MCATCGCTPPADALSKVELIKAGSNLLRGNIAGELRDDTPTFTDESAQLLKFHGVYQQEDRDRRKEARLAGGAKHHQMMVRTRIPGGVLSAESYLTHDTVATEWGNGTLRVTTRQDFQLHGVLKGDLHSAIRSINDGLLTTLGGCGDVQRNIMCCPAPVSDPFRSALDASLTRLVAELTPSTGAYHEIWLDGELAVSSRPDDEAEPLYGDRYLPRKFKTAIALEDDNCVDVFANDLGFIAVRDSSGGLSGFTVLVGGGLGRTRNKPDTFAAAAQPLATIAAGDIVPVARAVIGIHRDHGNRADRRHARLKYLLAARGLDWFRQEVESRTGLALDPPQVPTWPRVADHLGWHEQGDGRWYLGLHVDNGRIADTPGHSLRSAIRRLVEDFRPQLRLTAQQNVIFAGMSAADRRAVDTLLDNHGVARADTVHPVRQLAMACPAIPTCGLAVAESERVMPALVREVAELVDELGLTGSPVSVRMTGCPNGCARPYLGDVGLIGTTLGKYDLFLGGDPGGTRLNELYAPAVPLADITTVLRPVLLSFADEREAGESFGDWCHRIGVAALQLRFAAHADDAARESSPPEQALLAVGSG